MKMIVLGILVGWLAWYIVTHPEFIKSLFEYLPSNMTIIGIIACLAIFVFVAHSYEGFTSDSNKCIPCETPERLYEKCQHKYHACKRENGEGHRTSYITDTTNTTNTTDTTNTTNATNTTNTMEGMDDRVAMSYYRQGMIPNGPIPSDELPTIEGMDDRVAMSYYRQGMIPDGPIPSDEITERFTGSSVGEFSCDQQVDGDISGYSPEMSGPGEAWN